jgi:hypothetical protein
MRLANKYCLTNFAAYRLVIKLFYTYRTSKDERCFVVPSNEPDPFILVSPMVITVFNLWIKEDKSNYYLSRRGSEIHNKPKKWLAIEPIVC